MDGEFTFVSMEELAEEEVTAAVPIGTQGRAISVTYRPYALTTELLTDLDRTAGKKDKEPPAVVAMRRLIARWGLKAKPADAEPIPLTAEGLRAVPVTVLRQIVRHIYQNETPGEN